MIDINYLREHSDEYRHSLKNRELEVGLIDEFLRLDELWRKANYRADVLRSERNVFSKDQATAKQNSKRLGELKTELTQIDVDLKKIDAERLDLLLRIPNIIDLEVPIGPGESANKPIRTFGQNSKSGDNHAELMKKLNWLDTESASLVSGARFRYLLGEAALAEMKLMNNAVEFAYKHGFTPVIPPVMAREKLFFDGGFLPTAKEDMFATTDDLLLAGTSEPLLVALAGKEVKADELPIRFVGFSTCFRREAGSYGKDTLGMFRQHQFDKVEMVSICAPEQSKEEHEFLVSMQEKFIQQFDLPYQVVLIGSGDLERKAVRRYDIESWFAGESRYRETHSCSNCTDYQARRYEIKIKGTSTYAHTLNGTLATERLLLALIEHNQAPDGAVQLPSSLR